MTISRDIEDRDLVADPKLGSELTEQGPPALRNPNQFLARRPVCPWPFMCQASDSEGNACWVKIRFGKNVGWFDRRNRPLRNIGVEPREMERQNDASRTCRRTLIERAEQRDSNCWIRSEPGAMMLLPLTLGQWPAQSVDFGVYTVDELTAVLTELNLVKKRVEQGKRAAEARDKVANETPPPPNSTNRKNLNELTATCRYSASPTVDLRWVPIWVFLGLVEFLTPQQLTFLAMSRGAFRQAVSRLWHRPLRADLAQTYRYDLQQKNATWAGLFCAEVDDPRVQSPVLVFKRYHGGTTKPSRHPPQSSLANQSPMPYLIINHIQRAQLEQPSALTLLSILHIWGGQIPRMMVNRVREPRKEWSDDGEVKEVMLDSRTVSEFARPDDTIHWLQSHDLLKVKEHEDGFVRLSIQPSVSQYIHDYMPPSDEFKVWALMLVCHLFPGDKDIEPFQHKDLGRLQLRPLQKVVEHILEPAVRRRLSNQELHLIAKTLLESSNFPDPSTGSQWQFQALELAEQILSTNPDHKLHMLAVIRRKALSRLVRGEIFDDEDVGLMQHFQSDAVSTALLWDFQLSKAQDCVQRDDFSGAIRAIHQAVSCPPAKLSTLEGLVHKRVRFQYIRYQYLAGEFDQAKAILKQELAALQDGEKVEDTLMVLLVGVHCELRAPSEALRLAKSAVQNQKGSMRMNILLAEAHLHAGIKCTYESMKVTAEASFSEAKSICEKAMRSYESHPHFDQVAGKDEVAKVERIAYLRAVTVIARISALKAFHDNANLDDARENWIKVFQAVSKCGWKKRGFMEGMCHYTMAALGEGEASRRDMALASTLLQESGFRNLIIGLGRVWFDILGSEVARRGGQWISLEQSQVKI